MTWAFQARCEGVGVLFFFEVILTSISRPSQCREIGRVSSKVCEMMLSKLLGASNMISDRIFDGKSCVHAVHASFLARLSVCTPKNTNIRVPRNKHQPCSFQTQTCSQTYFHRCKTCLEHLNSSANQRFTRYKSSTPSFQTRVWMANLCFFDAMKCFEKTSRVFRLARVFFPRGGRIFSLRRSQTSQYFVLQRIQSLSKSKVHT